MEKLSIIGDQQGNTHTVELTTANLDLFELEIIFSGQLGTPNRGIAVVKEGKSVPISPEAMERIRGKSTPEQKRLTGVATRAMKEAQLIQIFSTR